MTTCLNKRSVIFILVALTLSGCFGGYLKGKEIISRPSLEVYNGQDLRYFIERFQKQRDEIKKIKGLFNGELKYYLSSFKTITFTGVISIENDQEVDLKLFDNIGSTVSEIKIRDNQYEIRLPSEKGIISGSLDQPDKEREETKILDLLGRLDLSLFGIPILNSTDYAALEIGAEELIIYLLEKEKEEKISHLKRRIRIPRRGLLVEKIEYFDRSGNISIRIDLDDYRRINGLDLPHNIKISKFGTSDHLLLKFHEIIVNR